MQVNTLCCILLEFWGIQSPSSEGLTQSCDFFHFTLWHSDPAKQLVKLQETNLETNMSIYSFM